MKERKKKPAPTPSKGSPKSRKKPFYVVMEDLFHGRRSVDSLTPEELTLKSGLGENLVHYLAVESKHELVERLIQRGVPCDEFGDLQNTPLRDATSIDARECVRVLLNHGADPNKIDKNEESPLHFAARHKKSPMFEMLVAHGGNPDVPNLVGETAREIFDGTLLQRKQREYEEEQRIIREALSSHPE